MMVCEGSSKFATHTGDLASKQLTGRNIKVKSAEVMVHIKYIKEKLAASTHELGSHIDDSFHKALEQIMLEQSSRIKAIFERNISLPFVEKQLQSMS